MFLRFSQCCFICCIPLGQFSCPNILTVFLKQFSPIIVLLRSRSADLLILLFPRWTPRILRLNFQQSTKHYVQVPFGLMLHIREADINQQHMNSTHYEETPSAGTKSFVKITVTQGHILISKSPVKCEQMLPCTRGDHRPDHQGVK